MLYYVDRCYEEIVDVFTPKIPSARMLYEDDSIPRICLCRTIEDCINAASWGHDEIEYRSEHEVFRLYTFDEKDVLIGNIIESDTLWKKELVPDAYLTGEVWVINQNLIPKKISYFQIGEFFDAYSEPILKYEEFQKYLETDIVPDNASLFNMVRNLDISFISENDLHFGKTISCNLPEHAVIDMIPSEVEIKKFDDENHCYEFTDEIVVKLSDIVELSSIYT